MWDFYKLLSSKIPGVLYQSLLSFEGGLMAAAFLVLLFNRRWGKRLLEWDGISKWWALIPLALFIGWGTLAANYESASELAEARASERAVQVQSSLEQSYQLQDELVGYLGDNVHEWRVCQARFQRKLGEAISSYQRRHIHPTTLAVATRVAIGVLPGDSFDFSFADPECGPETTQTSDAPRTPIP